MRKFSFLTIILVCCAITANDRSGASIRKLPYADSDRSALKPAISDYIQYVSSNGDDRNDGLSWGTAKLTVYKALQTLPGGSSNTAGTGTVLLSGVVNYGGPAANGGFWIMGSGDANFGKPPLGWLRYSGPILLDCASKQVVPAHGHNLACQMNGGGSSDRLHPIVWISAVAGGLAIKNIAFNPYLGTYVKYGIDSNNNRNGIGGSSGFSMENVSWNFGRCGFRKGPGMDIGSNSFWIWLKDMTVSGCASEIFSIPASNGATRSSNVVTITTLSTNDIAVGNWVTIQNVSDTNFSGSFQVTGVTDGTHFTYKQSGPNGTSGSGQVVTWAASAINIDAGLGSGSGLIFIEDANLNNGGIRLSPGENGGGVYVHNVSYEGDFTDPDMPPVLVVNASANGILARVDTLEVSDNLVPIPGVEIDNAGNVNNMTVSRIAASVKGPMTVLGTTGIPSPNVSPLRSGQFGLFQGRYVGGGIDTGRRMFSPSAVPAANFANTSPSGWSFDGSCKGCTITGGFRAPDGTSNAGRVAIPIPTGGPVTVMFYGQDGLTLTIGDIYVYGVWIRSVKANAGVTAKLALNADGFGAGDSCTPTGLPAATGGASQMFPANILAGYKGDGEWQYVSGFCKIYTNPNIAGFHFDGVLANPTVTADFYNPVLMRFPSGTISDNEAVEIANNLSVFASSCTIGQICGTSSQTLNMAAYATQSNCAVNSASPAACGSAASGVFAVPRTTTTYTVNTTAITVNSRIFLEDITDNTGIPSLPTCTALASFGAPQVSSRVAGTSFTISLPSTAGTTCFNYWIVN